MTIDGTHDIGIAATFTESGLSAAEVIDTFQQLNQLSHHIECYGPVSGNQFLKDRLTAELEARLVGKRILALATDDQPGAIVRCASIRREPYEDETPRKWNGGKHYYLPITWGSDRRATEGSVSALDIPNSSLVVKPKSLFRPTVKDWVRLVDPEGQPLVRLTFPEQ